MTPRKPKTVPVKWDQLQYQPAPSTPVVACKCGAKYLDDAPGRQAHRIVFSHDPEAAS